VCLHGDAVCDAHRVLDLCVLCGLPRTSDSSGWTRFSSSGYRCPACGESAVESKADARQRARDVCADLSRIGIGLRQPVRVELVEPDALRTAPSGPGFIAGRTHRRRSSFNSVEVTGVTIARGLPKLRFGTALAHEIGHCWVTEQGINRLDRIVEEGLCQVFAGAWLKKQDDPLAGLVRAELDSPDEVYGGGYRLVRAAIQAQGIDAVLSGLRDQGRLP
jgi:hypothetical protein